MSDSYQLKKAVLRLAKYVEAATWRTASDEEKANIKIFEEIEAILEA